MKNFWIRTASAVVYAALMIFCTYAGQWLHNETLGSIILSAFLLFVAVGGMFEFYRMAEIKGLHPCKVYGYVLGMLLVVVLNGPGWLSADNVVALVMMMVISAPALILILMIIKLWQHDDNPIAGVGATLLGVLYVALPLSTVSYIRENLGAGGLMLIFLMVWINDSFAYMGGSLIGRHKLWPRHSPGKTWEGSLCGMVFTILAGVLLSRFFAPGSDILFWVLCALVASIIGTLGDLAESMLKRSCGLKDSGNIMPGHGGFLDRFDSILAMMPFILLLTIFF